MRKGIHPLQRALTVINTKGASSTVLSVLRPQGGLYFLQSDTTTHPAWTGKKKELGTSGRAALFKQKFDLSLSELRGTRPEKAATTTATSGGGATPEPQVTVLTKRR
jgi:ribosomal protein L31